MQESIEDAKRAADLDPLSPQTRGFYINGADVRRPRGCREKGIANSRAIVARNRFRFHLRFGDPVKALQMARSPGIGGENQERFLVERANRTEQNIDYIIGQARPEPGRLGPEYLGFVAQALGEFGRNEHIIRAAEQLPNRDDVRSLADVYFRPALNGLRHDPRFMQLPAPKAGLVSYWKATGHWPDFCSEPGLPYKCKEAACQVSP